MAIERPSVGLDGNPGEGTVADMASAVEYVAHRTSQTRAGEVFPTVVATSRTVRICWFLAGWIAVAVGSLGIVLPVLPTTPFFIGAAYCFSRSSPRFEAWVIGLPGVGPMVRDYRAGFGVPRRVKAVAISMVVAVGTLSVVILSSRPGLSVMVAVLCLIGIATIVFFVPLRERVLAERGLTEEDVIAARRNLEI